MKFKVHFEYADGTEDSVILEADTIEQIREQANYEVNKRNGLNPWSEEI